MQQPTNLQPLRGWITPTFAQYNGRKLGPYYVRRWKQGGKLKQEYIKLADLDRVRAACAAYKERLMAQRASAQHFTRLTGNLNYLNRIAKRAEKTILRPQDYAFLSIIAKQGIEIPGRPKLRTSSPQGTTGGSTRRGMGAYPATQQRSGRQPQTANRKPSVFIHPSRANLFPRAAGGSGRRPMGTRISLAEMKAILSKPMQDKYKQESTDEKLFRWFQEAARHELPPPNVARALPSWLTREENDAFVQQCIACDNAPLKPVKFLTEEQNAAIFGAARASTPATPPSPLTPTHHPRNAADSQPQAQSSTVDEEPAVPRPSDGKQDRSSGSYRAYPSASSSPDPSDLNAERLSPNAFPERVSAPNAERPTPNACNDRATPDHYPTDTLHRPCPPPKVKERPFSEELRRFKEAHGNSEPTTW